MTTTAKPTTGTIHAGRDAGQAQRDHVPDEAARQREQPEQVAEEATDLYGWLQAAFSTSCSTFRRLSAISLNHISTPLRPRPRYRTRWCRYVRFSGPKTFSTTAWMEPIKSLRRCGQGDNCRWCLWARWRPATTSAPCPDA